MEEVKISGWTNWDDPNYEDLPNEMAKQAFNVVVKEVKEKGYKFSGYSHQYNEKGTPIINNKYKYCTSCRVWGDIMAEAYNLRESEDDTLAYVLWAWTPMVKGEKDGKYFFEEEIFPE
jgi:hypothetical protein